LGRAEIGVSTGQREPVRLPNRGHADDPGTQVEVSAHALHDLELLEVLLSEERQVRAYDAEKLGDDRRHSIEVARSDLALPPVRQRPRLDGHLRAAAVHDVDGGREHDVDALGSKVLDVGVDAARVRFEVLVRPELRRIHEDGYDDEVGAAGSGAYEREVSFMEGTHGRDEAHRPALTARLENHASHLVFAAQAFDHSPVPCA